MFYMWICVYIYEKKEINFRYHIHRCMFDKVGNCICFYFRCWQLSGYTDRNESVLILNLINIHGSFVKICFKWTSELTTWSSHNFHFKTIYYHPNLIQSFCRSNRTHKKYTKIFSFTCQKHIHKYHFCISSGNKICY